MSQLDALSGNLDRWNKMTAEAHDATCKNLNRFIRSIPDRSEANRNVLIGMRDALFALHREGIKIPGVILERSDLGDAFCKSVKPSLIALTLPNYTAFLASNAMANATSRLLASSARGQTEQIEKHIAFWKWMANGIREMYGRAPDYADIWTTKMAAIGETPDFREMMKRLTVTFGDEVTPILGLRNDEQTASLLMAYAHRANKSAMALTAQRQFRVVVDSELGVFE